MTDHDPHATRPVQIPAIAGAYADCRAARLRARPPLQEIKNGKEKERIANGAPIFAASHSPATAPLLPPRGPACGHSRGP